jgi:CDGSH-type Zn-finger protein/uncharacterized Fe-S cluster protein YjdI
MPMSEQVRIYRYEGKQATVTWNKSRCIHAGECTRGLPEVFSSKHDPWGQPDNAPLEALAAVIDRCPSGALHIEGPLGVERPADAVNSVTPAVDGPLQFRGRIKVGEAPVESRLTLCRCGASRNKPYCDNSHAASGFRHDGRLAPSETDGGAAAGGVDLEISISRNGPMRCFGSLELVGADGTRNVTQTTWLCRCGGSHRKPYCDGTHTANGFTG